MLIVSLFAPLLVGVVLEATSREINRTQTRSFDAGCGGIFSREKSLFESPGYPVRYPADADCSYSFDGPPCPTYFRFEFLDFDVGTSLGCVEDRLEVGMQDAICGALTGSRSYFSETGSLQVRFVSDSNASGRGFRILVTRFPCTSLDVTTDGNVAPWPTQPRDPTPKSLPPQLLPFCCKSSYNTKRFFISSPGFPTSSYSSDCTFTISKANPNVCRLRMHFSYFWLEGKGSLCEMDFLEVDGKFICGCRTGLKVISAFEPASSVKIFRFKSSGFSGDGNVKGFVLEVLQDECPKLLAPSRTQRPRFHFYDDQSNRITWPQQDGAPIQGEKAVLVKESRRKLKDGAGVENFYFFAPSSDYYDYYDGREGEKGPRDVEETTYVETSGVSSSLPGVYDDYKCRTWNRTQWSNIAGEISADHNNGPMCSGNVANKPVSRPRQCVDAAFVAGYVQSPGFPYYYPGLTNLCYRFVGHPGYCAIKLTFVDFHLENSFQCRTDYLTFGGLYRYCGRSLQGTVFTFDLRRNPAQEMLFVASGNSCRSGFRGIYEQIPCHIINPPSTVYPTNPAPDPSGTPCGGTIQDNVFLLEVYDRHRSRCLFKIVRSNPDVCRVSLGFHEFSLVCGQEYLLVDNRRYCGQLRGQILNVNFVDHQLYVVYERSTVRPAGSGLRIRMEGKQISVGCDSPIYPEVPAERSSAGNETRRIDNRTQLSTGNYTVEERSPHERVINGNYATEDLCGIIFNATERNVIEALCEFLTKRDNSTECLQISPKSLYVPYNFTAADAESLTRRLDLEKMVEVEEVEVREITCDDYHRMTFR